ncbi:MAG TPA: xylose isomerase, partial [Fervidobacterium sp.]|nr:xylose isomerase [Fervidobacterium sp.]
SSEIGQKIRNKQTNFEELENYVIDKEIGMPNSGRQEELEGLLNSYIYKALRG